MKSFRTIFITATLLTVFTIACGGQDPVTTGDTEGDATTTSSIPALNPLTVSLTLDQTSRVVRVISGEGGTLDTTTSNGARYSIEIPQGALLAPTEVTLTPVDSVDGLPVGAEALAAVHFSPEGLDFLQPATVTVELPIGVNPDEVTGFAFVGDGKQLYQYPVEVEGSLLKFTVTHFSGVGALEELAPLDGLDELDDLSKFLAVFAAGVQGTVLPTAAEVQAVQAIATAADQDAIADILLNWYNTTVEPGLHAATTDDALLPEGLTEFVPWQVNVNIYGMFDVLGSQLIESFDLIASSLRNAIDKGNERCLAQDDWSEFVHVAGWIAAAGRLKLDGPERELDLETLIPNFCIKVVFEDITFPAAIAVDEEVEFSTKIGWRIGSGPVRHNPRISLEASFPGSSRVDITEKGVTDDAGNFSTTVRLGADSDEIKAKIAACFQKAAIACSTDELVAQGKSSMELKARDPDETDADLRDEICISSGSNARLVAFLKKGRGGLAGRAVQFSLDGQGSLDSASDFTDIDGRASVDFTAPDTGPGVTRSTASFQEVSVSQSSSLDIGYGGLLRVIPDNTSLSPGDTSTFTVSRCGPGSSDVVWTATGGTITADGQFTAGSNGGVFSVTATSLANPSESAQGSVVIPGLPLLNFSGSYKGASINTGSGDTRPCRGAAPPCLSVGIRQSIVGGSTVISLEWCGHISFPACRTADGSSCRILYEGTADGDQITVNAVQWLDLCSPTRQPNRAPPTGIITGTLVEGILSGTLTYEGFDPTTFSVTLQ